MIFPAIDLLNGQSVRVFKGIMKKKPQLTQIH